MSCSSFKDYRAKEFNNYRRWVFGYFHFETKAKGHKKILKELNFKIE